MRSLQAFLPACQSGICTSVRICGHCRKIQRTKPKNSDVAMVTRTKFFRDSSKGSTPGCMLKAPKANMMGKGI